MRVYCANHSNDANEARSDHVDHTNLDALLSAKFVRNKVVSSKPGHATP